MDQIGKSGARFDIDKAKWYNQQYIIRTSNDVLAQLIEKSVQEKGYEKDSSFLSSFCGLMKERVETLNEFLESGYFFFEKPTEFDEKTSRKKYKPENRPHFEAIAVEIEKSASFAASELETLVKQYITENSLSFGQIFPILRVALSGTTKGPDLFEMISLLGKEEALDRLRGSLDFFDKILSD